MFSSFSVVPQNSSYTSLAQECVNNGCSVDLFVLNNSHVDLATIGQLPKVTGGEIFKYTYFQVPVLLFWLNWLCIWWKRFLWFRRWFLLAGWYWWRPLAERCETQFAATDRFRHGHEGANVDRCPSDCLLRSFSYDQHNRHRIGFGERRQGKAVITGIHLFVIDVKVG